MLFVVLLTLGTNARSPQRDCPPSRCPGLPAKISSMQAAACTADCGVAGGSTRARRLVSQLATCCALLAGVQSGSWPQWQLHVVHKCRHRVLEIPDSA